MAPREHRLGSAADGESDERGRAKRRSGEKVAVSLSCTPVSGAGLAFAVSQAEAVPSGGGGGRGVVRALGGADDPSRQLTSPVGGARFPPSVQYTHCLWC